MIKYWIDYEDVLVFEKVEDLILYFKDRKISPLKCNEAHEDSFNKETLEYSSKEISLDKFKKKIKLSKERLKEIEDHVDEKIRQDQISKESFLSDLKGNVTGCFGWLEVEYRGEYIKEMIEENSIFWK